MTERLFLGHDVFILRLFCFYKLECKREAEKGFGDEIPKQVWAAAQHIHRIQKDWCLRAGRNAAYDGDGFLPQSFVLFSTLPTRLQM